MNQSHNEHDNKELGLFKEKGKGKKKCRRLPEEKRFTE